MAITGMTVVFTKRNQSGTDAIGNPIYETEQISVDDCLLAPPSEPVSAAEQQAITAGKRVLRVHLPKTFTGDVSNSTISYNSHTYRIAQDADPLMPENTPTRWNRYFRAEEING